MAHTEEAVRHINSQDESGVRSTIASQLGVNAVASPLGTVVDVNMRSPPCGGHMIKYGFMKRMSKAIWFTLKPSERDEIMPRMNAFPYPRGMAVINFDITKRVGKNISMKYYRKIMLIWSLVLADMFDHRSRVWQAFTLLCEVDHLVHTYWQHRNKPLLVMKTRRLINMLVRLRPDRPLKAGKKSKFPNFNTPNTHQLIELVERFLPLYENVEFFDTLPLEACHKLPKSIVRTTRYYAGRHNDVAERVARRECLAYVFHGGTWGPNHSLKLGAHWAGRRHPEDKSRPHPAIQRITSYCRFEEKDDTNRWSLAGGWRPAAGHGTGKAVSDPCRELVELTKRTLNRASDLVLRPANRIINTSFAREKDLSVGDDVSFGNGGLRFGRVQAMYRAVSNESGRALNCLLLALRIWKPRKGIPVIPFTFNVLQSIETVHIPSVHITGRVLVAHSCNTTNPARPCKVDGDGNFVHDTGNKNYRVRKYGLIFDNERLSPNWYRKPQDIPPNPLDSWVKYQTRNGILDDVRVNSMAIVLVDGGRVSIVKVMRSNKKRRVCRYWGGENNPESLLGKLVPLNKNGQAWNQILNSSNGVIAANFNLDYGMLPNEVLALVDWDWRTTWNLSTEYGYDVADDPPDEELRSENSPGPSSDEDSDVSLDSTESLSGESSAGY